MPDHAWGRSEAFKLRLGARLYSMLWRTLYHFETKHFVRLRHTPQRRLESALNISQVVGLQLKEAFHLSMLKVKSLQEFEGSAFATHCFIMTRMAELQESVELLCRKRRHTEASILALTQLELGLDILYVGSDESRAKIWFDHRNMKRHPWPVKTKIDWVLANKKDRYSYLSPMFKNLSAIKHGNPIMSIFSLKDFTSMGGNIFAASERAAVYSCIPCTTATLSLLDALREFLDIYCIDGEKEMKIRSALENIRGKLLAEWIQLLKDMRDLLKVQMKQVFPDGPAAKD